jgi:CubicO group peptidase (beta-lactamase class C family)
MSPARQAPACESVSYRPGRGLHLTSRLPVRRGEISIVIVIEGDVAPGFERVRDVFGDNFEGHGDMGAAVCVYRHGRKVVDLWGGLADAGTGRPWTRDTLQLVYSATKAATATCAHLLAQRGELDLDRPAAWYWPEFAAQGKADIPVRWLLSHRAGLPVIDNPMPLADLLAWDPMAAALAAQRPVWDPGTADGLARLYAALIGEVDGVRILDAASLAGAIAEQAAGPDRVLLVPTRFASGFMLPADEAPLGGPGSFGHPGRGGSLGFGDPESGVAFGYVVSHIRQDLADNRAGLLVQAVRACLE